MAEGVDLYTKYQTVNDWGALRRAGKTFAYFKGSDGMSTRDTGNWPAQARSVGIAAGLYGYAQPGSARDQYDLLRRTAQARGAIDLSPALDQEDPFVPGNAAVQFAVAWLLRAVEVGEIPVWYANDSFMGYCLPAVRAQVPNVWAWIARYGGRPKNPFDTWQFSSTRQVAGVVASGVDENTGEAPLIIGGGGASPAPTPSPTPGARLTIAQMEDAMLDPVIYGPTPIAADKSQVQYGEQIIPGCGGVLQVTPFGDDNTTFFGNPNPAPPVYCFGPGGGTGGGHSVVPAAKWEKGDERRATRNNCQSYEVPKGTTRVAYSLSTNGRVAVQFVPSYLLG